VEAEKTGERSRENGQGKWVEPERTMERRRKQGERNKEERIEGATMSEARSVGSGWYNVNSEKRHQRKQIH
jgi:hypothetical protein